MIVMTEGTVKIAETEGTLVTDSTVVTERTLVTDLTVVTDGTVQHLLKGQ